MLKVIVKDIGFRNERQTARRATQRIPSSLYSYPTARSAVTPHELHSRLSIARFDTACLHTRSRMILKLACLGNQMGVSVDTETGYHSSSGSATFPLPCSAEGQKRVFRCEIRLDQCEVPGACPTLLAQSPSISAIPTDAFATSCAALLRSPHVAHGAAFLVSGGMTALGASAANCQLSTDTSTHLRNDITYATSGTISLEVTLHFIHRQVPEKLPESLYLARLRHFWRQGEPDKAWPGLALTDPCPNLPPTRTPVPSDASRLHEQCTCNQSSSHKWSPSVAGVAQLRCVRLSAYRLRRKKRELAN